MDVSDRKDRFARAMVDAQPSIYAYVMSLVANSADAHDVLQQTNLVLWEKWAEYDPASPFVPWACGIARNKSLGLFRDRARDRRVLSQEAMEALSAMPAASSEQVTAHMAALHDCLGKLPVNQRQIILMRYEPDGSVPRIADALDRPARSVSVTLSRIRKTLFDCVEQTLAGGGA